MAFTPTVLADGQINLKIEPEVSEIDPENNAVTMYGYRIPGLNVRRATTTVELRDGQSFMMFAGLLQGSNLSDTQGLPWVGNVPVLGTLFRSRLLQEERNGPRHPGHAKADPAHGPRRQDRDAPGQ